MFKEFFTLELKSALKSPMVYIFIFIVAIFTFFAVATDNVQIGGAVGNVFRNSPHTLTIWTLILGLFGLLFAAAFFNNAALRDHNNQFNEILFSSPIKKAGYFWGRFLGALILSTLPMLGVFFGAWVGSIVGPLAGWVHAEKIGPFYFATLFNNYFLFILPNMFLAGSVIFFLAHKFKNTIISFVGAMGIIVAYLTSDTFLSDLDNQHLAALTDMFGMNTYDVYSRYFTPAERNTLSPAFEGIILQNRLIWLAVSVVISLISFKAFSFREKLKKSRRVKAEGAIKSVSRALTPVKAVQNFESKGLGWKQFLSFYKTNTISIVKNVVFKILAIFGIFLLFVSLIEGYEYFGLQSYPVTYKVIGDISGSTGIFMIIIVVFFSGELVWRDRVSKIHEVINATPHSSYASIFAKVLSLVSIAVFLQIIFISMGVLSQLMRGYTDIELGVYFTDFLVDTLPGYIIFAAIFVFIQTLVNNRYIGYFIGILFFFAWSIVVSALEIQSNMLMPGATPGIYYSDMSGFGPGMVGTHWFNLYWVLFAVLLVYLSAIFWPRSVVSGFKEKWKAATSNVSRRNLANLALIFILWFGVACFVFYNTQIRNSYLSSEEYEQTSIDYEKTYKKYQGRTLPILTDIDYFIDIFPKKRDVLVKADGRFKNKSDQPIDSLFFNTDENWNPVIKVNNSQLVLNDTILGFRIFELDKPLLPGESIDIVFESSYITEGFENSRGNTSVLENGTFFNNFSVLPTMGYSENAELGDKSDRKKHGLPEKDRMPALEATCSHQCMANYLTDGQADWVNVETVISTSSDQLAVAPGSLIEEWTEGDRRYFKYKVDHPSQNFYSFMSARYDVLREKYNGIDIEIYHDPKHGVNAQMMADAVRKSLKYYEENFGPYFHKQARILEFPRYSTFAQAFPGTMPYSESFGFIVNLEDSTENNVIDAVIAHEMAHQWWAHQEIPAKMQGGTMLTESFSEYSSLMVMKQTADDMKMKNFLKYDFDRYLRGRTAEREKELPLYKVENQGYIHYGKGSVILYALQDYIGADSVNAALAEFLAEYRYAEPPYPTSLDFLEILEPKVPDSLHYLIDDWFKHITLYDFRLNEVEAKELDNGMYEVVMDIEARKLHADSVGNETEMPLHEWVDIGVYADSDEEELIHWERVKFTELNSTHTLVVDQKPAKAAIDPRRILIERVIDDNVKVVDL